MDARYVKTEAGRTEMRERRLSLPRQARLLLVIIDGSKSGDEWLSAITGSSEADLQRLVDAGLIERQAAPAPAARRGPGPQALPGREPASPSPALPALSDAALQELIRSLGYRPLYDLLTAQARPRLGLINGYRMVLDVERCSGVEEVRALALRFVESVRQSQGAEGVRQICVELRALAPTPA